MLVRVSVMVAMQGSECLVRVSVMVVMQGK